MRGNNKLTGGTKHALPVPVILGLVPKIFLQRVSNLVNKFALLLHKYRLTEDSRDKPENDGGRGRGLNSCCKSVKYPSPADTSATSPSGGEVGRSMIEMLGVLAIIAVLTAGGLVGFSKAMSTYRWNMALGEWDTLINLVVKYGRQLKINDGSQYALSLLPILQATGELPDRMVAKKFNNENCEKFNFDCYIIDSLGNKIAIYNHDTGYIGIRYEISKNNLESCRMFMTMAKSNHNIIEYLEFYNTKNSINFYGDRICDSKRDGDRCFKNMTISQINEICKDNNIFKENEPSSFLIYWYNF